MTLDASAPHPVGADVIHRVPTILFFLSRSALTGFGAFGSIKRATPAAFADAVAVQSAAHDVVAHTGQVLHATAANKHYRVFLQVMPFAGNVGRNFHAVAQAKGITCKNRSE